MRGANEYALRMADTAPASILDREFGKFNPDSSVKTAAAGLAKRFDYDGSGNVLYIGTAKAGSLESVAVWQIQKFTYTGGNLTGSLWAAGSPAFDSVWADRASLSYR